MHRLPRDKRIRRLRQKEVDDRRRKEAVNARIAQEQAALAVRLAREAVEPVIDVALLERREEQRQAATEALRAEADRMRAESAQRQREITERMDTMRRRLEWPLPQARRLVQQGYSLEHTVKRTGWPAEQLIDAVR